MRSHCCAQVQSNVSKLLALGRMVYEPSLTHSPHFGDRMSRQTTTQNSNIKCFTSLRPTQIKLLSAILTFAHSICVFFLFHIKCQSFHVQNINSVDFFPLLMLLISFSFCLLLYTYDRRREHGNRQKNFNDRIFHNLQAIAQ